MKYICILSYLYCFSLSNIDIIKYDVYGLSKDSHKIDLIWANADRKNALEWMNLVCLDWKTYDYCYSVIRD